MPGASCLQDLDLCEALFRSSLQGGIPHVAVFPLANGAWLAQDGEPPVLVLHELDLNELLLPILH